VWNFSGVHFELKKAKGTLKYECLRTCLYVYTDMHMCMNIYIHTYTHIHTYIHTRMHIHTYVYTCIHTYTQMRTYIHTYVHTSSSSSSSSYYCHAVGPLVDPFRSHVSRSLQCFAMFPSANWRRVFHYPG